MERVMAERTVSATEARVHFGELLDSVTQSGDIVYVERAGVPQVVVMPINLWKLYQKQDPWAEALRDMEEHWAFMDEERKAGRAKGGPVDVEEIIRRGREDRDEQILGDLLGQ
jgi:prevent-host-death family protein